MVGNQIVTITLFQYRGVRNRWWAFKQMRLAYPVLETVEGLRFAKMLGSGGRNGFGIFPNFGVYGLLCTWDSIDKARSFFQNHDLFHTFREKSEERFTVYMSTMTVHGRWEGKEPFVAGSPFREDLPVAVITRATIRTRRLWRFWKFVPNVALSMEGREGLLLSIGVGELPFIQQVTFSLWENSKLMKAYAYQSPYHAEAVRLARKEGWFREDLFARLLPVATEGSWNGKNPLKEYV